MFKADLESNLFMYILFSLKSKCCCPRNCGFPLDFFAKMCNNIRRYIQRVIPLLYKLRFKENKEHFLPG